MSTVRRRRDGAAARRQGTVVIDDATISGEVHGRSPDDPHLATGDGVANGSFGTLFGDCEHVSTATASGETTKLLRSFTGT